MVNTTIATDKRLAGLSLESELLFIKTLPHLDRDGLILGDASVLWAQVCPRRLELLQKTEDAIQEWISTGMVTAYDTDNGRALWFPNFAKNQAGFRYDREQPSVIQCPPGHIRTDDGIVPDDGHQNSNEPPEEIRQSSGETPEEFRQHSGESRAEVKVEVKVKEKGNRNRNKKNEGARSRTGASAIPPEELPPAVRVFVENGGKFRKGKLADGVTTCEERAKSFIADRVADTPDSLRLWGDVVTGYIAAGWKPYSYTVMVTDYYELGRVPGKSRASPGGNGRGKPDLDDKLAEMRRLRDEKTGESAATGVTIECPAWEVAGGN
jgi:hypothetical protein